MGEFERLADLRDSSRLAAEDEARRAAGRPQRAELHHVAESRFVPFADAECRMGSSGDGMTFSGLASVFEAPYVIHDAYGEYTETVSRSAFDKTLSEGADVVFLVNHADAPLARSRSGTLQLRTDAKGLRAEARLDSANPRAQELKSMVDRGDMDSMSFTFRDMRPSWDSSYTQRSLKEVSLAGGDVSVVNFPANAATAGSVAMRALQGGGRPPLLVWPGMFEDEDYERRLRLLRLRVLPSRSSPAYRAQLSSAQMNNLPDSAFAYLEPGGTKDAGGRTVPRRLRHFAIHDAAHVRNALARIGQGAEFGKLALPKVLAAAQKFGIQTSESKAASLKLTARSALHARFTGTHTHRHGARGSQGGDRTHSHSHSHDGDSSHDHHDDVVDLNADSVTEDSDAPADADAGMSQLASDDSGREARLRAFRQSL